MNDVRCRRFGILRLIDFPGTVPRFQMPQLITWRGRSGAATRGRVLWVANEDAEGGDGAAVLASI
jgi:hypothetical protein